MNSIFYDLIIPDIKKHISIFDFAYNSFISIFEIIINEIIYVSDGTLLCHK